MSLWTWLAGLFRAPEPEPIPEFVTIGTPPVKLDPPDPLMTLARTAWGEARNQGEPGMQAVVNVVMNRAAAPRWWGSDVVSVCTKPGQFDCWNADDPNRAKLLAVTTDDPQFLTARTIAATALAGQLADITRGSDSYYAPAGVKEPPAWATADRFRAKIGDQLFYRVELPL